MEGGLIVAGKVDAKYVRENFPVCVAFADECRKVFGDGVKLVHAKENGKELGKPSSDGDYQQTHIDLTPIMTPEDYRRERRERCKAGK